MPYYGIRSASHLHAQKHDGLWFAIYMSEAPSLFMKKIGSVCNAYTLHVLQWTQAQNTPSNCRKVPFCFCPVSASRIPLRRSSERQIRVPTHDCYRMS
mmetsp:Transcript_43288/g.113905  ORF Transcript_43288/g.113905 Transcript_43288/m.113905 type:complete len:98 (+) Transcript_43288:247-540(+)